MLLRFVLCCLLRAQTITVPSVIGVVGVVLLYHCTYALHVHEAITIFNMCQQSRVYCSMRDLLHSTEQQLMQLLESVL
jgi:hypothetical protein